MQYKRYNTIVCDKVGVDQRVPSKEHGSMSTCSKEHHKNQPVGCITLCLIAAPPSCSRVKLYLENKSEAMPLVRGGVAEVYRSRYVRRTACVLSPGILASTGVRRQ